MSIYLYIILTMSGWKLDKGGAKFCRKNLWHYLKALRYEKIEILYFHFSYLKNVIYIKVVLEWWKMLSIMYITRGGGGGWKVKLKSKVQKVRKGGAGCLRGLWGAGKGRRPQTTTFCPSMPHFSCFIFRRHNLPRHNILAKSAIITFLKW